MFVGMDVHNLQVAVLDEKGKVVLESSGMWYIIYECFRKRGLAECYVANKRIKIIALFLEGS
jgi:hypothetical protein